MEPARKAMGLDLQVRWVHPIHLSSAEGPFFFFGDIHDVPSHQMHISLDED